METKLFEIRFWNYVRIGKENECWPWIGGKNTHGYGEFKIKGKMYGAHVISFAIHTGIWPNGQAVIRHTCNNRACCNPTHLIDGTRKEDVDDRTKAGHSKGGISGISGSLHGQALTNEDEVRKIRALGLLMKATEISKLPEFRGRLSRHVISKILHNINWKGV